MPIRKSGFWEARLVAGKGLLAGTSTVFFRECVDAISEQKLGGAFFHLQSDGKRDLRRTANGYVLTVRSKTIELIGDVNSAYTLKPSSDAPPVTLEFRFLGPCRLVGDPATLRDQTLVATVFPPNPVPAPRRIQAIPPTTPWIIRTGAKLSCADCRATRYGDMPFTVGKSRDLLLLPDGRPRRSLPSNMAFPHAEARRSEHRSSVIRAAPGKLSCAT